MLSAKLSFQYPFFIFEGLPIVVWGFMSCLYGGMTKKNAKINKPNSKATKTRLRNKKIRLCVALCKYEAEAAHDDVDSLHQTIVELRTDGTIGFKNMNMEQLDAYILEMIDVFDLNTTADAEEFLRSEGCLE